MGGRRSSATPRWSSSSSGPGCGVRRILARTALTNQLLGTLDLVFPGLDGCFADLLGTRVGPVLLHELADPDRLHRLGVAGLQAFVGRRGVRLPTAQAQQLHQAAADALRLPATERARPS